MLLFYCLLWQLPQLAASWSGSRVESLETSAKETTRIVTGLSPNTSYKFRIFAQNSIGKSIASQELLLRTDEEGEKDVYNLQFVTHFKHSCKLLQLQVRFQQMYELKFYHQNLYEFDGNFYRHPSMLLTVSMLDTKKLKMNL